MIPPLQHWIYSEAGRLGGGGYAQVYRCRNAAVSADEYAIKVLDAPTYANTFEREVRALKILKDCPAIPKLIDYGRNAEKKLCIITDLVPGVRLDKHIRRNGPLSYDSTLALIEQFLVVLAYSHSKGLLHKDIKASNVLMDEGRFTLLDWGVGELLGNGRSETIRANQDFVAPECYHGEHGFAVDFYSLGWLAVYALTGSLPYDFTEIREQDYRVVAHCLQRPVLPADIPVPLRSLIYNWIGKKASERLVGYNLPALLAGAQGCEPDFSAYRDLRQIQREFSYIHLAARQGIPYAQYQFALRLLQQRLIDEAVFWLQKARDAGFVLAIDRLSMILVKRGGKDRIRAESLMQEAAHGGNVNAQLRVGMSFLNSSERDVEQAGTWLRLAADNGLARAQYELGRLLQNELGKPDEASIYLAMAAERGYPK